MMVVNALPTLKSTLNEKTADNLSAVLLLDIFTENSPKLTSLQTDIFNAYTET